MIVADKAPPQPPQIVDPISDPTTMESVGNGVGPFPLNGTIHLPTPPTNQERFSYLNPSKFWACWGLFAYLCVLGSSLWFLWRTHFWWYLFAILLTAMWTLPHLLFVLVSKNFDVRDHIKTLENYLPTESGYPSVDVFITTCGEDLRVIENTFSHASRLIYPSLRIYALDDGASLDVERLARKYGLIYITRPNRGVMKKAGNLLHGFHQSQGDFILVLDADFVVTPCALEHMVPWMRRDPKIAILQTPQYFHTHRHLTWPERGAAYCQEVFYRAVQPARDHLGLSAICVGTNALYRREALEQIGGFYQVPASEDVHNGVALINRGWRVKYIPILLARGLCPDTAQSLFKQHYRWCSGSMRLLTSWFFWGSRMPVWQKFIYACGACYYPSTALSLLVALLQVATMVFWLHNDVRWYVMFLFLPEVLMMYLVMPLWNQSLWGLHSIKAAITFSWAYLIAIGDFIFGKTEGWIASGSRQGSTRYLRFRRLLAWYCVLHLLLLLPVAGQEWQQFLPIVAGHSVSILLTLEILISES